MGDMEGFIDLTDSPLKEAVNASHRDAQYNQWELDLNEADENDNKKRKFPYLENGGAISGKQKHSKKTSVPTTNDHAVFTQNRHTMSFLCGLVEKTRPQMITFVNNLPFC